MTRMTTRSTARGRGAHAPRAYARAPAYGVPHARGTITPRAVMLLLLCGGPVLLIGISFLFGVGLQALGLVHEAKHGGILGGLGGIALTVLLAAFFCIPGYFVAVLLFGIKSRLFPEDVDMLKKKVMSIPLTSLLMFWLPAVVVPKINLAIRIQVAGLTIVMMLIFGYLWIIIVRIMISSFIKIGVIH